MQENMNMENKPFGRQLKPVTVTFSDGEQIDRDHWMQKLAGYLLHQPCSCAPGYDHRNSFTIYPDANND